MRSIHIAGITIFDMRAYRPARRACTRFRACPSKIGAEKNKYKLRRVQLPQPPHQTSRNYRESRCWLREAGKGEITLLAAARRKEVAGNNYGSAANKAKKKRKFTKKTFHSQNSRDRVISRFLARKGFHSANRSKRARHCFALKNRMQAPIIV